MNFSELVTSSVLLRALAIVILALTVIAALIVGMVELLERQAVNPIVWTIVGTGVVQALAILNINYGVVLQPAPKPIPSTATPTQSAPPTSSAMPTTV